MNIVSNVIQRQRFPLDIMLLCVRWYVAYALSPQQSGRDNARARRVRRSFHNSPLHHQAGSGAGGSLRKRRRKRGIGAVGKSWRLDATYIKIRGEDRCCYRAVDKQGNTGDFLLSAKRNRHAARMFFERAFKNNRLPKIVNIDKSAANKAGIGESNAKHGTKVVIRQCKYLNNIVEQDHRPHAVKRITRPIQGFKDFRCARIILSGIEIMHMMHKGQISDDGKALSPAQRFYALAT